MAGSTSNVSQDDVIFFRGQFRRDEENLALARAQKKKTRRRAELLGVEVEILDQAIKLEGENDATSIARLKTLQLYTRYLGLPFGHQFSFFGDEVGGDRGRLDELEEAFAKGRAHGLEGAPRDEQAYPPLTEIGMRYAEGYDDGQDVLKQRLLAMNEEKEEPKRPRGRPRKPPPEAQPAEETSEGENDDGADGTDQGEQAGVGAS